MDLLLTVCNTEDIDNIQPIKYGIDVNGVWQDIHMRNIMVDTYGQW